MGTFVCKKKKLLLHNIFRTITTVQSTTLVMKMLMAV